MSGALTVELREIGKSFGGKTLFSGVNAKVGPGECLAVTGVNGSGKSTLLKIVAGLTRPTRGSVILMADGVQVAAEGHRRLIGLVSPEVVLYNGLTGFENIDFLVKASGAGRAADEVAASLTAVGLGRQAGQRVQTYSTGMRQRLKLALIAVLAPAVWLLDEPSTNLDGPGKELVASLIRSAAGRGAAVVLATNEPTEVYHASRILELA